MTISLTPIGRAAGPGDQPHTYRFTAADPAEQLTLGRYVGYHTPVEGASRLILGRVVQRQPHDPYPPAFSAHPTVAPQGVARLLGYVDPNQPLYTLTVQTLGYYDPDLREFRNPRIPPPHGALIGLLTDAQLTAVLNPLGAGETGALHLGSLLDRPAGAVYVDAADLTSTHLGIVANTGAGKSYLAGVLIEELLRPTCRAAILLFDPHGEYGSLQELTQQTHLRAPGYRPRVQVLTAENLQLSPASLTATDIAALLPDLSETMSHLLYQVVRTVRDESYIARRTPEGWTLADLLTAVDEQGKGRQKKTAEALRWRLESVFSHTPVFQDGAHGSLTRFYQPGQVTIVQLATLPRRTQQVIVATLLRRLLRARVRTHSGRLQAGQADYLPYPVFTLLDEAHRFAPAVGEAVSKPILKEVLAEGRKFGLGVGVISQRPSKLDGDVLSQCNTHCFLRLVNDLDQRRVAESVETVGRHLLAELPNLTKGQAIVAGRAVATPLMVQVRTRHTTHLAQTLNAPQLWVAHSAQR